jgi:hypothetical protein
VEHGLRVGDAVGTKKFEVEGVIVSFTPDGVAMVKLIGIDALIGFFPKRLTKVEDERECARIAATIAFDL